MAGSSTLYIEPIRENISIDQLWKLRFALQESWTLEERTPSSP